MKKPDADNSLRRIQEEIRAEAQVARTRAAHNPRAAAAPRAIGEVAPARTAVSIDELARFQFVEFIEHAYSVLLGRSPDSAGLTGQIRLLESGRSKIEILGNLRFSGEGRAVGVRVPWLLPRYLLAKAMRIPLIGYAIEWLVCLGGLPRLLRHQRAADAYHAARDHVMREDLAVLGVQMQPLREEVARLDREGAELGVQMQALGERFAPLHAEIGKAFQEARELRHLVLSMNHWLASLRQNLAALETAESEHLRKADAVHADVAVRLLESDPQRPARLRHWAAEFAAGLPPAAEVLDIGGGLDWLQSMSSRGLAVTAINQNTEIGQHIRDAGITVAVAEPSVVLARIADHSLDAVTILDLASILRGLPAVILLDMVRRIVRPSGQLLFGMGAESATIADRLEGRARAQVDGELIERALQASGFVRIRRVVAADDSYCLIASQPN